MYTIEMASCGMMYTVILNYSRGFRAYFLNTPRIIFGRAIAEAVSRWLPTAAARVRSRFWQVGFVVDKVTSGKVFSEYFGFLYQNHSTNFSIIITIQKYKRKIEVPPIVEGPRVAPFKGAEGFKVS
jgi:hypothetical protein